MYFHKFSLFWAPPCLLPFLFCFINIFQNAPNPIRPPELFNVQIGSGISEKTDIWSLGCTLYAMCCGESPFDEIYCKGDSIALAVLAGRIKFPMDWPYSDGLKRMITEMLNIGPEDRPDIHRVILQVSSMLRSLENRV